jgi:uncharacterized protein (UPF0332 family)
MPTPAVREKALLRISTSTNRDMRYWAEATHLAATFSTIEDAANEAIQDRFELAKRFFNAANTLKSQNLYRDAISRYYYCVYHAFRCVAFFANNGDDFQEHNKLHTSVPRDFPQQVDWQNDIKSCRLTRNSADYEMYPKTDVSWQPEATAMATIATNAISATRSYLTSKGMTGL